MLTTDTGKILAWKVSEGPYSVEDLPDDEIMPDHDYYYQWWVEVMVSDPTDDDAWGDVDIWFHTLDEAYKFKHEVNRSPHPVEMEV